ncbi:MAG: glycosyltransferase family 4 protein [Candidatus Omnitrophica bacterium]|nr:glycosyltransferase family 4 protein [Candidatus Omnitrophota bacterium]
MNSGTRKKIKIAEVVTRLDWSGAPDIVEIICGRLDPAIYDVTLIYGLTRHPSAKTEEFLKRSSGKITMIPYLKRDVSIFEDLAALTRLYGIFRRKKFDIVHTHTAKAGFLGRIAARLAGTPAVIHTPHGHDFYGYFGSLGSWFVIILEKIAALFADRIVVLTAIEKMDMLHYRICPAGKIEAIKSGIDFSGFEKSDEEIAKKRSEFGIGPDDHVVGMVGRLESIKGFEYFIDSAKIVLNSISDTRFLIVGEGALRSSLEERARRLGIEDKVIFTGWREDMPLVISILDVLVLASLNEAVGRVLLEAGAAGKPTVATAVGGIPEIIRDGETGILVPPRDPKGIAAAVTGLLKDENKRRTMGFAAKAWIKSNFNEDKMVNDIDNIYRELTDI